MVRNNFWNFGFTASRLLIDIILYVDRTMLTHLIILLDDTSLSYCHYEDTKQERRLFVLFPISFRFLGTYSVSAKVVSNITLDSYISTFVSLTLVMGVVFQLPVIAFFLGKMGIVTSEVLARYRKHSFIVIMLVAAIIAPPDLMTLILVTIPLYLLYEVSIRVVRLCEH